MQAVQQILPETLLAYRLLQILVGGGNDTYIEISVRLVAYGTVPPFLYGTKQQLLRLQRQIAYLVQKQRTAICLVEISLRGAVSTRKCALDMPENADGASWAESEPQSTGTKGLPERLLFSCR